MKPRAVLIGGAGLVGQALVRTLARAGTFEPHVIDLRRPAAPGVRFDRADLLADELEGLLAGAEVVVHLAAQVNPPHPRRRASMRRLHEEGTARVLRAAVRGGVKRFVLCSSAVVYGAHPDNPVPLVEDSPCRPNPDFPYAVDKARQEQLARAHAREIEVVIARPAIIYARQARSYLTEILRRSPGVLPAIDGRRPPLQFVHVDDVAQALARMAASRAGGVFNVCPQDWLAFDEVARLARLRPVYVPRRLVAPALDVAARWAPSWLRAPSYILDYLSHPFVLSGARLEQALGFRPQHASAEALLDMLGR